MVHTYDGGVIGRAGREVAAGGGHRREVVSHVGQEAEGEPLGEVIVIAVMPSYVVELQGGTRSMFSELPDR